MGIKYSFIDNVAYGPEDINDITRSLTGAGIAPFLSKDSYNVSDLNAMTGALVTSGAELGGCKCAVEGSGTAEMIVTVAQGIIFFESGVRLTVDRDGYIISVSPDTEGVVYAHYSPSLQKADILFGTELPSDGECVELARILTDGTIKDTRTYARSKIATLGKNVTIKKAFEDVTPELISTENRNWYIVATIDDVDLSKFEYIMLSNKDDDFDPFIFYDIKQDKIIIGSEKGATSIRKDGMLYCPLYLTLWYWFKVIEGKPCIVEQCSKVDFEKHGKYNLPSFEARFM
ncbi:MAG: hypothetical protein IKW62_04430 [Clostridia bacterium]|nr:hypothetical protein [Clostridia bacterium]